MATQEAMASNATQATTSRATELNRELPSSDSLKLLRECEVAAKLGVSQSTVQNRINPKSRWYDEAFPKPVNNGPPGASRRTKRWNAHLVNDYIRALQKAADTTS